MTRFWLAAIFTLGCNAAGNAPRDEADAGEAPGADDMGAAAAPADAGTGQDAPPTAAVCANGIDDDGDGHIDFPDDPGCASAKDAGERNTLTGECGDGVEYVELAPGSSFSGSNAAAAGAMQGSCGGFGAESIFRVTIAEAGAYVASTVDEATSLDTVVYIRSDCADADSQLACNDEGSDPPASTITLQLEPGDVFVVVDSWSSSSSGAFVLRVFALEGEGGPCEPDAADACAPGLVCRAPAAKDEPLCLPPVCSDGVDDDGDGEIDFPFDPGCERADDADEADPATLPECGNGEDDDGDDDVDYPADPGCGSAADAQEQDECIPGVLVDELGDDGDVAGTTAGQSSNFTSFCGGSESGEDIYSFQVTQPLVLLRAWTAGGTTADVILFSRTACADAASEEECATGAGLDASLEIATPTLGTHYIFVDGAYGGSYTLHVRGVIPAGGACEEGSASLVCVDGYVCSPSGTCDAAACDDGVDDDGDGFADYPDDPGCTSASDDSEADPAEAPECANSADDDADGTVDYPDDPGCAAAADDSEIDVCSAGGDDVTDITIAGSASGSTVGQGDDYTVPCLGSTAPEVVYLVKLPGDATTLRFSLCGSSYDTAIVVRREICATGSVIGCQDDSSTCGLQSDLTVVGVEAGLLFVFVDGFSSSSGAFALNLSGTLAEGEPCNPAIEWLSCSGDQLCLEAAEGAGDWRCRGAACNNDIDDDGDGFLDFPDDLGCVNLDDADEQNAACLDGEDDDGDFAIDYPADPGCADPQDESEDDPATAPACADTEDDDGDFANGWPDDPGCYAASDASEDDPCGDGIAAPDVSVTRHAEGSTSGLENLFAPTGCATSSIAADAVYLYRALSPRTVTASLANPGTGFDTVLFVRSAACTSGASEIACNDDRDGGTPASEVTFAAEAGDYYLVVSGYGGAAGDYELTISEEP